MLTLSIIVPVYNVKQYLKRCIDSILNQSYSDFEVIIVDDGSTDGCSSIVDEYEKKDSRIRVIHKKNGGLMSAWMSGLRLAKGDYIGFVDSDDYIDSQMYNDLVKKGLENNADIVLCNHYYDNSQKGGDLSVHVNPIPPGLYRGEELNKVRYLSIPQIGRDYISPSRWSKIIKKDIIEQNLQYCDTRITSAEDVNIIVPCLLSANSLYYIDKPLYYYVYRDTSISNVFKEGIFDTYLVLVRNLSKAINSYIREDNEFVAQLWNFYGFSWCGYVLKSKIPIKEKKRQILRLYSISQFSDSVDSLGGKNGKYGLLYKFMLIYKKPLLFIICCEALYLIGDVRGFFKRRIVK